MRAGDHRKTAHIDIAKRTFSHLQPNCYDVILSNVTCSGRILGITNPVNSLGDYACVLQCIPGLFSTPTQMKRPEDEAIEWRYSVSVCLRYLCGLRGCTCTIWANITMWGNNGQTKYVCFSLYCIIILDCSRYNRVVELSVLTILFIPL